MKSHTLTRKQAIQCTGKYKGASHHGLPLQYRIMPLHLPA
ncbi:Uncharacterized protein ChrSV_0303 [Chromobacterium vaccinii]|nr:Uncharacterized protein ChrSW_0303 [Chromobacterium vaccinii]QND87762.1 Uncharacterized protein ChrSV_0303 [Chromobacterium vaccinii]